LSVEINIVVYIYIYNLYIRLFLLAILSSFRF